MNATAPSTIKTILHPVSDLASARQVYAALLGGPPQVESPYYVGFDTEQQHVGLVPAGGPLDMRAPVAYWHVPDIEAKLAELTDAGATVRETAHHVGGGRMIATVMRTATSSGCSRTGEQHPAPARPRPASAVRGPGVRPARSGAAPRDPA